jgi:predicted phage terminase large subunit-like protein
MRQLLTEEEMVAGELLSREDFYFFSRYMYFMRNGHKWLRSDHHKLIADFLMRIWRGEIKNGIINIPPRYSKTELAVINFPAWALGHNPDCEFIHVTYGSSLATDNSADCRDLVDHEAYKRIFPGTEMSRTLMAKDHWGTTEGGIFYATGVAGPTTGKGAGKSRPGFGGAIIVDDPHKADEARSEVRRNAVIKWFAETLQSRRNDPQNTPRIVIMQRLHERDLTGWLLEGNDGEHWDHLCLPAVQYDAKTNERFALWPAKHTLPMLDKMEVALPYMYAGQYAQRPAAAEGNIFKPDKIEIIPTLPIGLIKWIRGWDFAASVPKDGSDPDYTAGGKLGQLADGRFVIAHVRRMRGTADKVEEFLVSQAKVDGRTVKQDIPQDPGQAGKGQVLYFTKKLAGFPVVSSPESGDKVMRAEPLAAQVNVGNVMMLEGDWNQEVLDELRMFPNGAHDDMVDCLSRAFARLTELPQQINFTDAMVRKMGARR